MRKAGRFTSALLLVVVGAAVITDQYAQTDWTQRLVQWWPLLLIALGLEYLWFNSKYGGSDKPIKLDLAGLIFAVIISAIVMVSMHADQWVKGGWPSLTQEKSYDKGSLAFTVPKGIERIELTNPTGNVTVRAASSDQLEVQMKVFVRAKDEDEAAAIVQQSRVETSSGGNTLNIQAHTTEQGGFFGIRKARMDLVVLIPEQALNSSALQLSLTNGSIVAEQIKLGKPFKGTTTNGAIHLTDVEASQLDFQSTNAKLSTTRTKGSLRLQTTNGAIEAEDHAGDLRMKSTNGQLTAIGISGGISAETTNGGVHLDGTRSEVQARTTNGSIEVKAASVNGDWNLHTNNGKIEAVLPFEGDYQVHGKGQTVSNSSSLPLNIQGKAIDGKVGTGKYRIQLDTNGSLLILAAS